MMKSAIIKGVGLPVLELFILLVSQDKLHGFLILANKENGVKYDNDEIAFLATLSHQAGMALENAYLLRELTEKERLKKELEIARNIQKRLLPQADPQIHGLDISGICIPADEVGGDYFDYFKINEDQIGLVIADVAGKGTSAAFYMAEIKVMISSPAFSELSLKKLLTHINKRLCQILDKKVFATMIYGLLDIKQRQFKFVRAGHNALIVKRNGTIHDVEMFIPAGIALGLTSSDSFELNLQEEVIILNNGDILVLYIDGISEAMNNNFKEFSEERLVEILEKAGDLKTSDFKNNILSELRFGPTGPIKVWINDRLVLTKNVYSPAVLDRIKTKINLNAGLNLLLIKCNNRIGELGFYFRIIDENGYGYPDMSFSKNYDTVALMHIN